MFNLFGKKESELSKGLKEFIDYKKVSELLEKGKNLIKLGRNSEAVAFFTEAERIATSATIKAPRSVQAHTLLAIVYQETKQHNLEEKLLDKILNSGIFNLTEEQRIAAGSELYKIRREKAALNTNTGSAPEGITKVYSCQHCGRLMNFATIPCPHCHWYPSDTMSLARSFVLSSNNIEIPSLLLLAREIASGRASSDIVPNLDLSAKKYHDMPESASRLRYMFDLLQNNAAKNQRDINMTRSCPACGEIVLLSHEEECGACGEVIDWPDAIRLLLNVDNLLWLLEQRAEVSDAEAFSEMVCLLVSIVYELLWKQEVPSPEKRRYALSILSRLKVIADRHRGAVITFSDLDNMEIYLIKDNAIEDSEHFGMIWFAEMKNFVLRMQNGVAI